MHKTYSLLAAVSLSLLGLASCTKTTSKPAANPENYSAIASSGTPAEVDKTPSLNALFSAFVPNAQTICGTIGIDTTMIFGNGTKVRLYP
ncbi:hypothetical protein, partial [Enterobacter cloacae complex sp. 4DZ1-17B1]|uniref:hypothetical protein n=1 Tax=Enterobacter cloacae complex sp. 4DZ1-17B1 TaxID=2511991 RepID=UPI001CA56F13